MKRKIIIPAVIVLILAIIAGIVFISANRKYDIPILMYHNLCESEADVNSQTVTAKKFENDLAWLKDNGYTAVLPRDLAEKINDAGEAILPNRAVIITFDDGYRSNYELAFPLLEKYDMKAEVSVITSLIDQAEETYLTFCTWDMLREMEDSGVFEIGSHTDNMHNPDNGGMMYDGEPNGVQRYLASEVMSDIKLSYEKIASELGSKPITFAYPYGEINVDAEKDINALFAVTFTTTPKMANLKNGAARLARFRVDQNTDLRDILK